MMAVTLDEISIIGAVAGIMLGAVMGTYYDVAPALAFRGLQFLAWTVAGLAFVALSKPRLSFLLLNLDGAAIAGVLIFISVVATAVVQGAVQALGLMFLAPTGVPLEMVGVYLVEAAISETFLYFGVAAFFATYLHPYVGLPFPPAIAYFMHQYVYGATPLLVWAVVASFAVQAVAFVVSGNRLSVPLGAHAVVNVAPFLMEVLG